MALRIRVAVLAFLAVLMFGICEESFTSAQVRRPNNRNRQLQRLRQQMQKQQQQLPQTPLEQAIANLKAAQKQMEDKQYSFALQNVRGANNIVYGLVQQKKDKSEGNLDKALATLREAVQQLQYKKNDEATGSVANALDMLQAEKGGGQKKPEPKKKN